MRKKINNTMTVFTALVLLSLGAVSCSDSNKANAPGPTTISGSVEGPVLASQPIQEERTALSRIKRYLTLIRTADAQGSATEVVASQNGTVVDTDTLDNGQYSVVVPGGGAVNLDFITPGDTFSTTINVTPSSTVILDVALLQTSLGSEVDIKEFIVNSPPISVSGTESFRFDEPRAVMFINGGGQDCVSSTGISADPGSENVYINVEQLELAGCDNCVFADGNQNILIQTEANEATASVFPLDFGDIVCVASADAVKAEGQSTVVIENDNRDGGIFIVSENESGVQASGSETVVEIDSGALGCQIVNEENIISEDGATIVTPLCEFPLDVATSVRSDPECGGTNRFLKGSQIVTKNSMEFGKYVFDVTPVPSNGLGMINGFFLLNASCSGSPNPGLCPPFWGNWNSDHAEIDFEFVPGYSTGRRPVLAAGSDCSADNTACNASFVNSVTPPRNFVSFNTFAFNKSKSSLASNRQSFYEMSTSPFGKRDTYTMYYTPCGVQWSIGSENGDSPLLYQNSAHISANQNDVNNFIHTVDFKNLKGKELYIYINYYSGLERSDFAGRQRPPANTKTDIYSVKFFPIEGSDACSTPSENVPGAACSIDGNNQITCSYSGTPSFVSDFENGNFQVNGGNVNSWTDLWHNINFNLDPIYTDQRNAVYSGTGNPLEMHFRCLQF